MNIIEVASGSSGNCTIVETSREIFLLDIGISGKRIVDALNDNGCDTSLPVIILVSHSHSDHLKIPTLRVLNKKFNISYVHVHENHSDTPQELMRGVLSVSSKHGDISSATFIIERDGRRMAYTTDINCLDSYGLYYSNYFDSLDFWHIEANWDVKSAAEVFRDDIQYGYDVMSGMRRHMSFERAKMFVEKFKPKEINFGHLSSRFADKAVIRAYQEKWNEQHD